MTSPSGPSSIARLYKLHIANSGPCYAFVVKQSSFAVDETVFQYWQETLDICFTKLTFWNWLLCCCFFLPVQCTLYRCVPWSLCKHLRQRICRKGIDSNSMCRGKKIILAPIKLIFISDLTSHVRVYGHKRNDLFFGSNYWLSPTTILSCKFFLCQSSSSQYKIVVTNNHRERMTRDSIPSSCKFWGSITSWWKYFHNTEEDNSKLCRDVECTCEQWYLL